MGAPVECAGEGGGLRAGGGWPSPHGVRTAVGRANEGGRGRWGRGSRRSQRVGAPHGVRAAVSRAGEGVGLPCDGQPRVHVPRALRCGLTRPCEPEFFFSYFL